MHPIKKRLLYILLIFSLFFSACASFQESPPLLTREPYLQSITNNSVIITFNTPSPVTATVTYHSSPFDSAFRIDHQATKHHAILLDHLQPGTTYIYTITIGNIALHQKSYYFTTDNPSQSSVHFAVVGDIGAEHGFQKKIINTILTLPQQPAFLLIAGDVVYPHGLSQYYDINLFNYLKDLAPHTPIFPALGNHDWNSDPKTNFEQEWELPNNEHYYSFDYGNAHFTILDSLDSGNVLFDEENQTRWLIHDLATHQNKQWRFVMAHYPGITCTYKPNSTAIIKLYPIFEQYHVDIYFTGHAHTYERLYPIQAQIPNSTLDPNYINPLSFITITTGAAGRLEKNWQPNPSCFFAAKLQNTAHFVDVKILTNTLFLTAYNQSGAAFDHITVLKTGNNTLQQNQE